MTAQETIHKRLNDLFEQYQEENAQLFPLNATANGDNRYNDQLPDDQTQEFRNKLKEYYLRYSRMIKEFTPEHLNASDKISYDIFSYEMRMQLEGLNLNVWMMPFNQFWGLPLMMGQMGAGIGIQPFKTVKDYDNWVHRICAFSNWVDSAIDNFRKGMVSGVVLPKSLVIKMIPQMEELAVSDPEKSLFFKPIKNIPKDFSIEEEKRITDIFRNAIQTEIVPTYKKLAEFFRNEYLPAARETSGICDVPGGAGIYDYEVKFWTTTRETPEQIYQTGLSEIKRITQLMFDIKNKVGFEGTLKEFFKYMKTDEKFFPFDSPQQILAAFEDIHYKMQPNLKKMFTDVPKTPFEIRQTEAFRAASSSAEYNPGSPDGTRPGIFYVPILDAKKYNTTSGMESLFLHEAIPGHHFQISLQQEDVSLPKFRRFGWYGAYGEGYALYCESLGKELGLYTDPFQYMGALGEEIHRAIRLVVDVAIHTKGMTREDAIRFMTDHESISEEDAIAEIERYMAIPGQALAYKIGQLKLTELRNKYEKKLGGEFRITEFHHELLKDGCMPLDLLEKKMDAWAAAKNHEVS